MKNKSDDIQLLTFGGHLEMLRKMLFRIVLVIVVFTILIFSFKEWTFQLLLAPREWNFATYRLKNLSVGADLIFGLNLIRSI